MKYSLQTKNVELSVLEKEQVDKKLRTLSKHLHPPYTVHVSFHKSMHHETGEVITCIINIEYGKRVFHSEREGDSVQTALDRTIDALRMELKKFHDKLKRHGGGVQK